MKRINVLMLKKLENIEINKYNQFKFVILF